MPKTKSAASPADTEAANTVRVTPCITAIVIMAQTNSPKRGGRTRERSGIMASGDMGIIRQR